MKLIKQFDETDCGGMSLQCWQSHFGSHLFFVTIKGCF